MAGHRLARALSDIFADTHVKVRQGLLRHEQEVKAKSQLAMAEHIETQLRDIAGPAVTALLDNPGVPDEVKDLFKAATQPTHFADAIISTLEILGSVFTLLPAAGTAYAQNIKNQVLHHDPVMPADIGALVSGLATKRISGDQGYDEAQRNGFNRDITRLMVDAQLAPLAPDQIMQLIRRGQSDESVLLDAAHKTGIHEDWAPGLRHLIYHHLDPGTATAARVESHIDGATHAEALAWAGIDPKWADVIYETAGRPPGLAELAALMNRGLLSEATLRQAIAESDVKNKYADAVVASAVYLPPPRSIVAMMRSGAVDPDYGRELLQKHGLSARDAELFVREATHGKAATARHAAVSLILQAYQDFEIDRAAAERMLTNLSYDAESTVLSLGHAEALRGKKIRDAEVSRIRTNFDKRWIDRQAASAALDRAGVPSAARDQLLAAWDVEREVSAPHPTVAQLVAAYKKQGLDDAGLQAEILALGYSPKHAAMLMHSAGATPVGI